MNDDEVYLQGQRVQDVQSDHPDQPGQSDHPDQPAENLLVMSRPMPALRLNQPELELAPVEGTAAPPVPTPPLPPAASSRWIRPLRAVTGLLLLVVAWAGLLAIALLVHAAVGGPFTFPPAGLHPLLPIVELIVAVWIAAIVGMSILVGAFLLRLALTVRGW